VQTELRAVFQEIFSRTRVKQERLRGKKGLGVDWGVGTAAASRRNKIREEKGARLKMVAKRYS